MSEAAKQLAAISSTSPRIQRGPKNVCAPIYAPDIEDCRAIEEFRLRPNETWKSAQIHYDNILGIGVDRRIHNDKFRYHWKRWCFCWPDDLRQS